MLKYLVAFAAFFASTAWATDCHKHPVYCHIIRVAPKTPNAMELSNSIARLSKKHKVDPHLVVGIIMQESGFRVTNRAVLVVDANGCRLHITDYGIMQVNEHSIKAYGLNADLLSWNRDYQLWAGVFILKDKIKTFGHWSAYHSMTPKHNQQYRQLVGRYL